MSKIDHMKEKLLLYLNYPYVPLTIKAMKGPILLHLSDTPEEVYPYIFKMIELINPQYIVHTGDIVDNIKLETNENYLPYYMEGLKKFIQSIEKFDLIPYYIMGNHDRMEFVKNYSTKGIIMDKGIIWIEGNSFFVTHDYEVPEGNVDYYLFGHQLEPNHYAIEEQIGLNGLLNMNVIDLSTGSIGHLEYPIGTNYYRKIDKGSIGL